jgi:hypothetical protein
MRPYTADDRTPFNDVSFYRLKQTDYDGKYSYAPVVAVKRKSPSIFDLSSVQVEADRQLLLTIASKETAQCAISLLDLIGRTIA